jgi:hypothetical protein
MKSAVSYGVAIAALSLATSCPLGTFAAQAAEAAPAKLVPAATGLTFGPELLDGGQLEAQGGWAGYVSGSSAGPTIAISEAEKHSGNASLHVKIARNPGEYPGLRSPRFATQPGRTYRIRFWMKVTGGAVGSIRRNGADNDERTLNAPILYGREWTEYTTDYTEVKGGNGAYIAFYPAHVNAEFYLDDVSIREVTATPDSVRAAWRERFPGKEFVLWQKGSPWANLNALQSVPAVVRECDKINVALGRKEYESVSFVITNISEHPLSYGVRQTGKALPTTVRQGLWITPHNGNPVNDALALLEKPIVIPSGESREIWLTLHSAGKAAGTYDSNLVVTPAGKAPRSIALSAKVYPVTLPEDKPLYTCYWDNVVPTWVKTPGLAKAQMQDLKDHYTNVGLGHPWIVPPLRVDAAGKLVEDYSELDVALENYKTLKPKMIVFNWNRDAYFVGDARGNSAFGTLPPYMSDAWKELFKGWLRNWVAHMKQKGFTYDQFAMYPDDENLLPAAAEMAKLIKEADPNVLYYVNNMGQNLAEAQAIAPYVDIYSPLLYDYLNVPPFEADPRKVEVNKLLKKKPQYFWTYANPPHHEPQESSGYADYRLAVWDAWKAGMRGFGYFIYSYKTHWNSYNQEEWPTWSVVYFADAPDAPADLSKNELVIPGKRWEATREGVEDYTYFDMLQKAVNKPRKGADPAAVREGRKLLNDLPTRVLANPNDEMMADRGKEAVLRVLAKIS